MPALFSKLAFAPSGASGRGDRRARLALAALTAALAALMAAAPGAEAGFGAATSFPAGDNPHSVAVGDFNGDADPDLAVANRNSTNVSVLLGTAPGGSFGAKTDFPVVGNAFSVAVGDFNGDDDLDLAVVNGYAANSVSVLLGGGDGSFGAATNFPVGNSPFSVAVGNFNGDVDADPDLAVANGSSGNDDVSVLLGGAGGSFGAATNFPAGDGPISVAVGDFNGDADPDLAVANQQQSNVSVLLGTAPGGSFGAATNFTVASQPFSVAVGDFNGGADPDLAVTTYGGQVSVLLGGAAGSFGAATNFPTADINPFSVAVGEFNDDADPDLAVANFDSDTVSILLGTAPGGSFGAKTDFAVGDAPRSVATGNFNGDAYPDLAVANGVDDNVSVLLGTDSTPPDTQIDTSPPNPSNDPTGDFTFSETGGGTSFQCRVDAEAFSSCTSPHATASLIDGEHTFQVRAIDAAGNVDPSPASHTWTVDTTPPDTQIGSSPPNPSNDPTGDFTFSSTGGGTTFQCRVDAGPFAPCTSPHATATLADGSHTFEVRALDAAGNVDGSPASHTWTVDTTPPDTSIGQKPKDKIKTRKRKVNVTYAFSSTASGSTFECSLDGAAPSACTSPQVYSVKRGTHSFDVVAIDAAGNRDPTPATDTFKVVKKR